MGVLELGGSADRDSGEASGRAVRLRSREPYVRVGAPDWLGTGGKTTLTRAFAR